jgi:hypothetical protein
VSSAIRVARSTPECMHVSANRTRPENTVMKLFDAYYCHKDVQSTLWLVKGPDFNGDCILSWAYVDPSKTTSALGWSQKLQHSDFNMQKVHNLHGFVIQDSSNCSQGYNINFLVKDPSNLIHKVHYNASEQSIDRPMLFTIRPNETDRHNTTCGESLSRNGQSC